MLEIRRIDRYTYDLFYGTQWGSWTRVRQGRSSTYRVAGDKIPHADLKDLHDVLAPNMPITYGQTVEQMLFNINALMQ